MIAESAFWGEGAPCYQLPYLGVDSLASCCCSRDTDLKSMRSSEGLYIVRCLECVGERRRTMDIQGEVRLWFLGRDILSFFHNFVRAESIKMNAFLFVYFTNPSRIEEFLLVKIRKKKHQYIMLSYCVYMTKLTTISFKRKFRHT